MLDSKIPGNGSMTLLDLHNQFEKINTLTIMCIEIFVKNRTEMSWNVVLDEVTAIMLLIDSEAA